MPSFPPDYIPHLFPQHNHKYVKVCHYKKHVHYKKLLKELPFNFQYESHKLWTKFIFPIILIVFYGLLLRAVPFSSDFAVLRPLQCLLTFNLLFSEQKCNVTDRVNIVSHDQS